MKFIDSIKIRVESGRGGPGLVSFRSAQNQPKLGPDGGDGGHGGNVYLVASSRFNTLAKLYYNRLYKADDGDKGGPNGRTGKSGDDLEILVPKGTVAKDFATGAVLGEVIAEGERLLLCKGGKRGLGNIRYVSATHQIPTENTPGGPSESLELNLELKLMADVGFAGFPNGGKSTLLSTITKARPKIADYPFTTLNPQLGVVDLASIQNDFYGDSFVVADIPGLIEGAHEGRGLGHDFLRHLERTQIIAYVVDPFSVEREDPLQSFADLRYELAAFSPELGRKPALVVLTKSDIKPEGFSYAKLIAGFKSPGVDVLVVSAVTGEGIPELKRLLFAKVTELKNQQAISVTRQDAPKADKAVGQAVPEGYELFLAGDGFDY